jgi:hypothetical protein
LEYSDTVTNHGHFQWPWFFVGGSRTVDISEWLETVFRAVSRREIIPKATGIGLNLPQSCKFWPIFDRKFLKLLFWKNFLRMPLLSANKYRSIGPLIGVMSPRSPKIKKEQTWETTS